ncbi:MAG: D-aminoacylase [Cytophagales bacterium]|nr:D-aminoacylase [Cytophagales bacterium]
MKKSLTQFFALVFAMSLLTNCIREKPYDLIIRNGKIYDGTGAEAFEADIAINGDQIIKIGDLQNSKAAKQIDAQNLAVAPGFIDLHAHIEPLLTLPGCESLIRQGVTTALGGPDGSGPWPLGDYLDTLETVGIGMNVAFLVGHNTVRKHVMSLDQRAPTADELAQMKQQIEQGMKEGAFGISTGLKYLPGAFSEVDEVIALSKVASAYGGFYTSHLREEGLGLIDAVREAILIGREADIPIVLTHHKVIGKPMWGKSVKTLALVDSARNLGLDVMMDQYPYDASYTSLSIILPAWARAGGEEAFRERTRNPKLRDSIRSGTVFNILNDRGGADLRRVQFAKVDWMPALEGKTLHDWAISKNMEPTVENGADLVIEAQLNGGARCIFHVMDENDVERIMQHPQTMIASDGRLVAPGMGHPHPRWYGTFPRVLGHYVREKKIITLPAAIHKMTGMPAKRLGLADRGTIAEGMKADMVVFDPEKVIDKATFENPHQYPEGIDYVLVNGVLAVDKGKFKDHRSGNVLKKN